jgi:hypothetical protein
MDADERSICLYLKSCPGQFIAAREISRRAGGKRRAHYEPNWAAAVLSRLVERGLIESDSTGHYRLRPPVRKKNQRFLAPNIRRILEQKGGQFEQVLEIPEEDEFA